MNTTNITKDISIEMINKENNEYYNIDVEYHYYADDSMMVPEYEISLSEESISIMDDIENTYNIDISDIKDLILQDYVWMDRKYSKSMEKFVKDFEISIVSDWQIY